MIWTVVGLLGAVVGLILLLSPTDTGMKIVGVMLTVVGGGMAAYTFAMRLRLEHDAGKYGDG